MTATIAGTIKDAVDTTGCDLDHPWIETFTGKRFTFGQINPDLIDINDIAHALSMQCRYAGHCRRFYSVAEHSVLVMQHLNLQGAYSILLKAALLHDASEAYLGDVTRPLKLQLREYRIIEEEVQDAIWVKFGCWPIHSERLRIKDSDNAILAAEARWLMPSRGEGWGLDGIEVPEIIIDGMFPAEAKAAFLNAWEWLNG